MSDDVRALVQHLNAAPFNKGLTLIAFDGLAPFALLSALNDVLCHISGVNMMGGKKRKKERRRKLISVRVSRGSQKNFVIVPFSFCRFCF